MCAFRKIKCNDPHLSLKIHTRIADSERCTNAFISVKVAEHQYSTIYSDISFAYIYTYIQNLQSLERPMKNHRAKNAPARSFNRIARTQCTSANPLFSRRTLAVYIHTHIRTLLATPRAGGAKRHEPVPKSSRSAR